MPARKTPQPSYRERHYGADEIQEMYGVSQSRAYEIIHECAPYGTVLKTAGSIRASESALAGWYNAHNIGAMPEEDERKAGRPCMGGTV